MNYQKISPKIHNLIQDYISDKNNLDTVSSFSDGPIHIIFPEIFRENIRKYKIFFQENDMDYKIFFAHKTNKSTAFLQVAEQENIGIDVASKNELIHALSCGFTGNRISCSGPKSQSFLYLAMKHNCIISIDNINELEQIIHLYKSSIFQNIKILVRVNNLTSSDRNISSKNTKFGIPQKLLPKIYIFFHENNFLDFQGIHFHFDEHQPEVKAGALENAIHILQESYQLGFTPNIIDIGGGMRGEELQNKNDWKNYIDFLAEAKKESQDTHTWGNRAYGIHVNTRGAIEGRELIEKRYREIDPINFLSNIFEFQTFNETLKNSIQDSMFEVMSEPGYSLTLGCGFTLLCVTGYKILSNGDEAIIVNGNILNLSSKMWEYFTDPILIINDSEYSDKSGYNEKQFYGYIFGNLCRDDDILIQRKIYFHSKPHIGDYILFMNTSSYISDFEDASPISQEKGIKIIAQKNQNNFTIYPDKNVI